MLKDEEITEGKVQRGRGGDEGWRKEGEEVHGWYFGPSYKHDQNNL